MKNVKYIAAISILLLSSVLSGCSVFQRQKPAEEKVNPAIETAKDMDAVEDGGFYILHSDSYEKLYVQNANYAIAEQQNKKSANPAHTLWFKDDWSKIPTMYAGDMLIYKTSDVLTETFSLERFEYVGYTVGVTSLKQTVSGRYSYSSEADKLNINPDSDATQLYNVPTKTAIIDKIGFAPLREGNVSSGGCILGLEEGKSYEAEVYAGTFLKKFTLTADSIALTSMEYYSTVDYDFMQSQIIRIYIPEYFNSGYYLVNGYGLVRYINGTSYDEGTDFNIPNEEPQEEETTEEATTEEAKDKDNRQGKTETTASKQQEKTSDLIEFSLDSEKRVRLTITFDEGKDTDPIPYAYLVTSRRMYAMETHGNTITMTRTLPTGDFQIEVTGLNGRHFEFDIEEIEEEK